jgi:hypothetical protein
LSRGACRALGVYQAVCVVLGVLPSPLGIVAICQHKYVSHCLVIVPPFSYPSLVITWLPVLCHVDKSGSSTHASSLSHLSLYNIHAISQRVSKSSSKLCTITIKLLPIRNGTSYLSFAGIVDIGDLIPNRRRSQRARVKLCTLFARWTIDLWPPA